MNLAATTSNAPASDVAQTLVPETPEVSETALATINGELVLTLLGIGLLALASIAILFKLCRNLAAGIND